MKIDVEDEASYLDLRKVYLCLDAKAAMADLFASRRKCQSHEVAKVYSTVREFYKEVVVQIKNHISFDSDIFVFSKILDPAQDWDPNPPSLAPFLAKYSLLSWSKSFIDRE